MTDPITEDTPEGGPEDLNWQLYQANEKLKWQIAETERYRATYVEVFKRLEAQEKHYARLFDRLTVGVLRKAGFRVEIHEPEGCDTCGADIEDD